MPETTLNSARRKSTKSFGRFEVHRLLGEGGFASVYLARDPRLDRLVALKIPKPSMLESTDAKARFEREARAAAMLSHPAIVPVFECGEQNGQSYIASAYCPGQTLGTWIRRQSGEIDLSIAAQIIADLADAVGHAHQRGIVHRDLKPANVLIDGNETNERESIKDESINQRDFETQTIAPSTKKEARQSDELSMTLATSRSNVPDEPMANRPSESERVPLDVDRDILGKLRITDFGLAKSTHEQQELTVEGTIMGTPSYMSPEQASGRSDVGPATDIFTLGVMLFELVTGKLPFRRDSTLQTMLAIAEDPLPGVRSLRADIPKDLQAICEKATQKEPGQRYASAFEFASDLRAWIEGRPVKARSVSALEKFTKHCKRNRGITSAVAAALLSLTFGLAGTTLSWRASEANLERANFEFQRAEKNLASAQQATQQERQARHSAEQVATFMTSVFRSPNPAISGRDVKVIEILEQAREELSESFGDDPLLRIELMVSIGACYRQLAQYDDSLEILHEAEEFRAEHLADNGDMEIQIRAGLGSCWIEKRELDKAIEAYKRNIEQAEELGGADTQDYAIAQRNLGTAYMYNEQFDLAEPIMAEVVERGPELGVEVEDIHVARSMLAACYRNLGRIDEAIVAFKEVLAQQKEVLGENHPSCIETANNLAVAYSRSGQPDKAALQQEFILEQSRAVHGDDHPITIRCMNNLAQSYLALGRIDEATPLFRAAYELVKLKIGEKHINTVSIGHAFARSLLAQDETDEEAIEILEFGRQPMIDALGVRHGRVRQLLNLLVRAREKQGDYPVAIAANREVLTGFEDGGTLDFEEQMFRGQLVRLLIKDGQQDEADELASQLFASIDSQPDAAAFSKVLAHLCRGMAKAKAQQPGDAAADLDFVLERQNELQGFSAGETGLLKSHIVTLIDTLESIEADGSSFDPATWQDVLDSM